MKNTPLEYKQCSIVKKHVKDCVCVYVFSLPLVRPSCCAFNERNSELIPKKKQFNQHDGLIWIVLLLVPLDSNSVQMTSDHYLLTNGS